MSFHPEFVEKPTEYIRTKKHFRHENDKLFLLLQAAVFLCLFNDSVNGEHVSQITQRWIDITTLRPPLMNHPGLRQGQPLSIMDMTGRPADDQGRGAALKRFSTILRKSTSRKRTTMWFESAIDQCDYLALSCLRAYQTGKVCAKTVYYYYYTFKNYCMLDYANCMLRYEYYQAIHMGDCLSLDLRSSALMMTQASSHIMDGIYMIEQDFGL